MTLEQHITQVLTLSSVWDRAADELTIALKTNDFTQCDKALSNFRKIHRSAGAANNRPANDQ